MGGDGRIFYLEICVFVLAVVVLVGDLPKAVSIFCASGIIHLT